MSQGLIVKIDGIDGCGKSTLIENLRAIYEPKLRVATTREFGNEQDVHVLSQGQSGTVSRMLCEIALNPRLEFDLIERELALTIVARRQNRLVLSTLREQYDLILSDRSSLSSYAYGNELGHSFQTLLEWTLEPVLKEDWIMWIDIEPKVACGRARRNAEFLFENYGEDAVEMGGLEYLVRVRDVYKKLSEQRKNVIRLDGNVGISELTTAAKDHIDSILRSTISL